MGLDMYFTRRRYLTIEERERIRRLDEVFERATMLIEDIGYLRKTNAIHGWLIDNVAGGVDNCNEVYVSPEKIKVLSRKIDKVLAKNELAAKLLPTREGFFFGSQEYDSDYFNGLKECKNILKKAGDNGIYYLASW